MISQSKGKTVSMKDYQQMLDGISHKIAAAPGKAVTASAA